MRILVLGSNGMLGHQLCRLMSRRHEVWGTFRQGAAAFERFALLKGERAIGDVVVQDFRSVENAVDAARPEALINAVGIVKQRDEANAAIPSIQVNALFPHLLADLCDNRGIRLIHMSTDCVFSGARGNYTEYDLPDPVDLYGRTKSLGDLNRHGSLTLRTSIIGWELNHHGSLLEWFASQRGREIKGYRRAIYSGLWTSTLAELIEGLLETRPDLSGLYHVAAEPITKYELLLSLRDALHWDDIVIKPDDQFYANRRLIGTRFELATGWRPPSWDEMISGLAAEWPKYEALRSTA
jgi:dTDP-4-dehydrorhamnose reductase